MKYNAEQVAFMLYEAIDQNREYKSWHCSTQHLMTLVKRVVAEEREACAKLCDRYTDSCSDHEAGTAMNIQDAIRARGNHD